MRILISLPENLHEIPLLILRDFKQKERGNA
jgi:hypothetical protein